MKKRIYYYDNLKGLLMLVVIFYHIFGAFSSYYGYDKSLSKICGFFMMPLFIYVTGIFARLSRREPKERFWYMIKVFLVVQVITTLYYYFILKSLSADAILYPRYTLWYLLTCGYLYLSEYIFPKFNYKNIFIVSLILMLVSGFIPFITDFLSISRTINLFPFFVLGYFHEEFKINDFVQKYKYLFSFVAIGIIVWFLFNQSFFSFSDTYLKNTYYESITVFDGFIKRFCLLPIFFIVSSFVLSIIPKNKNFLESIGNKTLYFYLSHGIIIQTIRVEKLYVNNPFVQIVLTLIVCLIVGTIIFEFSKFIKYVKKNKFLDN